MADKPEIQYEVRQQTNRANGGKLYVPSIIERPDSVSLEEIVEKAIDRGLIVAIKPNAAKGVADGVARQMLAEFKQGNGVKFGDYFYARLYLDGTTDGDGNLSEAKNGINVRLYKGDGFKLKLTDFAWRNVDGGNIPRLDYAISDADGAERGVLVPYANILINGTALYGAADDSQKVVFTQIMGENDQGDPQVVEITNFIAKGPNLLSFPYPASLVAGRAYKVHSVRLRGGANYVSNNINASVEAGE